MLVQWHYGDVIMTTIASQITSLTIVYSTVYSGADQRKHQSSASLAFVRVIHRGPVNSPHKWPVTRKMFPFDDVIMESCYLWFIAIHNIRPKHILISNRTKSSYWAVKSFGNFVQSTAKSLPYSVHIFNFSTNEFSRNLSLRWVEDR